MALNYFQAKLGKAAKNYYNLPRIMPEAPAWISAAITSQAIMLCYLVMINHVDLYPWNNLVSSHLADTLIGLVPFSLAILAFAFRRHAWMIAATLYSYAWLGLQLYLWWLPYLFGPTPLHPSFDWYQVGGYTETIKFLPFIPGRPIPDAAHLALQGLSLLVIVIMTIALYKTWPQPPVASRLPLNESC